MHLQRALLSGAGLVVLLGLIECGLWAAGSHEHPSRFYVLHHPDGYLWNNPDPPGNEALNARAERDDREHAWAAEADVYRVLVLGDSLLYGPGLALSDTFPLRLRKQLESLMPDRSVELINCSRVGANLRVLQEIYQKRCAAYRDVDLVVLQVAVTDGPFDYALFSGEVLGPDYYEIAQLHRYYEKIGESERFEKRLRCDPRGIPTFVETPTEAQLFRRASESWPGSDFFRLPRLVESMVRRARTPTVNPYFLFYDTLNGLCPKSLGDFRGGPGTDAALKNFRRLISDGGAELLLLMLPTRQALEMRQEDEQRWETSIKKRAPLLKERVLAMNSDLKAYRETLLRAPKKLAKEMREEGAIVADPTEVLLSVPSWRDSYNPPPDRHLSPQGHERVALFVAPLIQEAQGGERHEEVKGEGP